VRLLIGDNLEPEPVQLGGLPVGVVETWDLAYSADSRRLAADLCVVHDWETWDVTCTVMVWDLAAPEQPVQRIEAGRVWAVALSGDGSRVYVGSYEAALDVYDVATGAVLGSIPLTSDLQAGNTPAAPAAPTAHVLDLSPDGTTLAVRARNDIVLLDAQTLTARARLLGHQALVKTMGFSHDGTRLASGDDDGAIVVWDVATGAPVEQLAGHTESVQAVAFGGDDDTLYSTAADRMLLAWDLRGVRRFIPRLATAPDPEQLSADAARPVMTVTAPDGEAAAYFYVRDDGLFGATLRFFDVATGRLGEAIETDHVNWGPSWRPPEFEEFVTGDLEGFVHVWDPRRGTMTEEQQVTSAGISALFHTPDGNEIVGLDGAGSIFQLDADTLEPIAEPIPLHNGTPGGVVARIDGDFFDLSDDGRTAVAVLNNGASAWVDLAEGRILHQADFGLEPARAGISPDGRRLAVAANTGEVGLLELDSWEWVRPPIAAHAGWALNVSWAPDGTLFASGGQDGRVILWDGRTGERLGTVLPLNPDGWGATAFFETDGHTVIIGTSDYDLFTWDTRLEKWIERACTIAGRNLTGDEWRDAFGDRPYHETCPTP
jgi:WD40 repeat protein